MFSKDIFNNVINVFKICRDYIICGLFLLLFVSFSSAKVIESDCGTARFEYNYEIYRNLITGATYQSYLDNGIFNTHDVYLEISDKLDLYTDYGVLMNLRITDDKTVNENEFTLQDYQMYFKKENARIDIGNLYTLFSKYSLSQRLDAVRANIDYSGFQFIPLYGRKWRGEDNVRYTRYVTGTAVKKDLGKNTVISMQYVSTMDDEFSVTVDTGIPFREKDRVFSASITAYPLRGLFVESEAAFSKYSQFDNAVDKYIHDETKGSAFRTQAMYRNEILNSSLEYEITTSSFSSLSGWAYSDRERVKINFGRNILDNTYLSYGFETYHDNVDNANELTKQTSINKIVLSMPITDFSEMDIEYSQRRISTNDAPKTVYSVRDALALSSLIDYKSYKLYFNSDFSIDRDEASLNNDFENLYYDFRLTKDFILNDFTLSPGIGFQRSAEKEIATTNKDKSATINMDMNAALFSVWNIFMGYSINNNTLAISNVSFDRTLFNLGISYMFMEEEQGRIGIDYSAMEYADRNISLNDYNEYVFKVIFMLMF
ncbi:MAG: hypothetical protein ABH857_05195 [Elusimicrobiota bacterium]